MPSQEEHSTAQQTQPPSDLKEDDFGDIKQMEHIDVSDQNIAFDEAEMEPQFHARTWIALVAFFLLNFVQVVALQGPASVVSTEDPFTTGTCVMLTNVVYSSRT